MKQFLRPTGYLALLLLVACSGPAKKTNNFSFTVAVTSPVEEVVLARYNERTDTFRLDSGRCSVELSLAGGTYIELQHGEIFFEVFGAPANDLALSFDASAENPVAKFSGSLAAENDYVEDRRLFDGEQLDLENNLYTAGEDDFILVNDSLRKIREQLLAASKSNFKSNVAVDFTFLEEALIQTKWLNRYLEHELYFPLFTEEKEYVPSQKMIAYRSQINPNDPKLLVLDEYLGMLDYYIELKKKESRPTEDAVAMDNLQRVTIQFATIDKNVTNKEVNQELKYRSIQKILQSVGTEGAEKYIADFIQTVADPIKREQLLSDFKKWQTIKTGEEAPEIVAEGMDGKTYNLSSLRGKYVYIDFWATWCKPCRDELPYLEKLIAEMDGQQLAIVSISVDENKDTWARIVRLQKMKGIQWFANKDELISVYNLSSIPRYMIIDPEGKIISSNAARPSGAIREQLKNLLKVAA